MTGRKPVPVPTPETQPFWDGCAAGELRIQRCADCGRPYFYPRPVCPACGSRNVEWFTASGRATLYSYVINHRPAPGFEDDAPYAIAVVELDEGPADDDQHRRAAGHAGGAGAGHAAAGQVRAAGRREPAGVRTLPSRGGAMTGVIIAGAAETDRLGRLPGPLHAAAARGGGAERGGRRGPVAARHRRHRHRLRAGAGPGGARARHHAALDRRHRRRRHLVPAARAARGRGHPGRVRQDGADHPRGVGPVPGGRFPVPDGGVVSGGAVRGAVRGVRPDDHVHHPGAAVHEGVRPDARAAGLRGGGPAAVGGEEPARRLPRPGHGRGRAGLPDGRLPVPPAGVLPGHRRGRRAGGHLGSNGRRNSRSPPCTCSARESRRRRR